MEVITILNINFLQTLSKFWTGIKEKINKAAPKTHRSRKSKSHILYIMLRPSVLLKCNMIPFIFVIIMAAVIHDYSSQAVKPEVSYGHTTDSDVSCEIITSDLVNKPEDYLLDTVELSIFPRKASIVALAVSSVDDDTSEMQGKERISEDAITGSQDNNENVITQQSVVAFEDTTMEAVQRISQDNNVAENNVSGNGMNRWNIILTDDEIDLLARIVWVEARGEPVLGQEAVVEVTFNRILSDEFPNDLYSVLSADGQYASWGMRDMAYDYDEQVDVVKSVLNGHTTILPVNTYYFATSPLTDDIVTVIQHHYFCR